MKGLLCQLTKRPMRLAAIQGCTGGAQLLEGKASVGTAELFTSPSISPTTVADHMRSSRRLGEIIPSVLYMFWWMKSSWFHIYLPGLWSAECLVQTQLTITNRKAPLFYEDQLEHEHTYIFLYALRLSVFLPIWKNNKWDLISVVSFRHQWD